MKSRKIKGITVNFLKKRQEKFMYSDGNEEDKLLGIYKKGLSSEEKDKILRDDPSWALKYHLSNERSNLLDWYQFSPGARVLEVGAGCGAITEAIVKNDVHVVANELSERRATINALRNKGNDNLEIVVGNLQDYRPKDKFDYVVCVGVLEYAGTFIHTDSPYKDFLKLLNGFLKEDGVLLLAIENKLGFKYLAGAKEDHTRRYFDGINNYPQELAVKTFGKIELTNILTDSGFLNSYFYYPYPDYKLPQVVFSDNYLPGNETLFPKGRLPSPTYDQPREYLFSEQEFVKSLEANKVFDTFANSFFVEATKVVDREDRIDRVVFSQTASSRSDKYKIRTKGVMSTKDKTIKFIKEPVLEEAETHMQKMEETYNSLVAKIGESDLINVAKPSERTMNGGLVYEQIKGVSLDEILLDKIINNDQEGAKRLVSKYMEILDALSNDAPSSKVNNTIFRNTHMKIFSRDRLVIFGIFDLNFDNIIIDLNGEWWLIDYEWSYDCPLPIDYIAHRAYYYFFARHSSMVKNICNRTKVMSNNIVSVPRFLVSDDFVDVNKLLSAYELENQVIQPSIFGHVYKYSKPSEIEDATEEKYFMDTTEETLENKERIIKQLSNENKAAREDINNLEEHIRNARQTLSYRIGTAITYPARQLKNIIKRHT